MKKLFIIFLLYGTLITKLFSNETENTIIEDQPETSVTAEEETESLPWFGLNAYVSSPINALPQTGIGIGFNPYLPFSVGIRGGISGPYIIAGVFYAEASAYLNVRSPEFLRKWRINYFGTRVARRAVVLVSNVESPLDQDDPNYFSSSIYTSANYTDISGYFAIELDKNLHLELGYSGNLNRSSVKTSLSSNITDTMYNDPDNKKYLDGEVNYSEDYFQGFERLSMYYIAVTYFFILDN